MTMYWHENQAVITLHSDISLPSDPQPSDIDRVIESLHLDALNQFLIERGFKLRSFTERDVLRPKQEKEDGTENEENGKDKDDEDRSEDDDDNDNLNSPIGKYLFLSPSQGTDVISFFHIERVEIFHPIQDVESIATFDESNTRQLVKLLNRNLDKLREDGNVPIVAAMPNWVGGATGDVTHGCPTVPPIPVPAGESCGSSPGRWPIELPQLSTEMQNLKGKDVTAFVLDTMPTLDPDVITQAANAAGSNNLLLQDIADQKNRSVSPFIKFIYTDLPDTLAEDAPDQLVTGRDICGRVVGFAMPDHGLFVTGIVRSLVPLANIECIRVLNDFGVGNTTTLIGALQEIQKRLMPGQDLYNKSVVINLSLVITPHHEELAKVWFGDDHCCDAAEFTEMMREVERLRLGLHTVIQSLTSLGAVIAASAGNDSGHRMCVPPRMYDLPDIMETRYPAAFPEVISVGAVDSNGAAALYSNYPAVAPRHNGVSTYGGGVPTPVFPNCPPGSSECQTTATDIDAPYGVYTASEYPALSIDDHPLTYPAPNPNAWAFWSGTSFATPIISAVAARVLEKISPGLPSNLRVAQTQWAITNATGQQQVLGVSLPVQPEFSAGGVSVGMLQAVQCHPADVKPESAAPEAVVAQA